MVKDITVCDHIEGVRVREVCSLLRDPQQFACYHREFNGDDDILMEDWRVSHSSGESSWERSVTYNLRLDVPGMVKRAIGRDKARIQDRHMVSLQLEDGICAADVPPNEACAHSTAMTFQCNPAFAPPGRPTLPFATINMRFTDTHRSGQPCCQVEAHATVTAQELKWLAWLHGVIERAMVKQARRVIETFLVFTKREATHYQAARQSSTGAAGIGSSDRAGVHVSSGPYVSTQERDEYDKASVTSGATIYYDAEDASSVAGMKDLAPWEDDAAEQGHRDKPWQQHGWKSLLSCCWPCDWRRGRQKASLEQRLLKE